MTFNLYDTHIPTPMEKCSKCGYWVPLFEQRVQCSWCKKVAHKRCFKEHPCTPPPEFQKNQHPAFKYARKLKL